MQTIAQTVDNLRAQWLRKKLPAEVVDVVTATFWEAPNKPVIVIVVDNANLSGLRTAKELLPETAGGFEVHVKSLGQSLASKGLSPLNPPFERH